METTRNLRRERTGVVVSNNMEKSITIVVKTKAKHPVYGKFVNRSSKFMAHDEKNDCQVGDLVAISESRPVSKTKTWMLQEILEKAAEA